ncbi:PqiC family protein [Halopseudomonas maritima]|uniref:PqiC family protein n=1 Tax=Halopseudomonas maritima TaxID=2918528 RepID=UPI001EECB90C|nr:PqiC family protein [Halopseudomonas maritima]UJJ32523.1 PqiC family protein [Halopseudomonas maritima]
MNRFPPRIWPLSGALILLVTLAGCSSPSPLQQHSYLLRSAQPVPQVQPVVLQRVSLPDYLYGDALVVLVNDNELYRAQQHRWAEPLPQSIERYLRQRISSHLGAATLAQPVTLEVRIDELLGTLEGQLSLVASYRIEREGQAPQRGAFQQQLAQPAEGYTGLVAGHQQILDQLAAAIAADLQSAATP